MKGNFPDRKTLVILWNNVGTCSLHSYSSTGRCDREVWAGSGFGQRLTNRRRGIALSSWMGSALLDARIGKA